MLCRLSLPRPCAQFVMAFNFEHLLNTIKLTGPGPASHRNHLTLNALPKAPFRLAKQPISQAQTAHTAAHGATARNQAGCTPHNITHADFHAQAVLQPACILLRVCNPRHARFVRFPGSQTRPRELAGCKPARTWETRGSQRWRV